MNPSLSDYTVDERTTLLEASKIIEANHVRTAIIIGNGKVVGVVSEGDIIRALIGGTDVHTPVKKFMQMSFIFLTEKNLAKAAKVFRKKFVTLIPVVTEDMELAEVITQFEILDYIEGTH